MSREVAVGDRRGWQPPTATPWRLGSRVGAWSGGRLGGRRAARRGEHGAVTAEAVVVLPVLVAFTLGLVWLVAVAVTQVRVVDAARETARVAARGESDSAAVSAGEDVAPRHTEIAVHRDGDVVRVVATAEVDGPGGIFRHLPGLDVRSTAVARMEPQALGAAVAGPGRGGAR